MSKRTDRKALKKRRAAYVAEGNRRRRAEYLESLTLRAHYQRQKKAEVLAQTMDMHNAQMYHDNPELFAAARGESMVIDEATYARVKAVVKNADGEKIVEISTFAPDSDPFAYSDSDEKFADLVVVTSGELETRPRRPTLAEFDEIAARARENLHEASGAVDRLA